MEMNHFFIVDLVKHRGDTIGLINSVIAHVRSKYSVHEIGWYVREDQVRFLGSSDIKRVSRFESNDYITGVLDWITELSKGAAGTIVHVLSYDGVLLGSAATLN